MRTATKLGLLASLYLSQGLPFGFFTQALPVVLRESGASLAAIGMVSALASPWALKFLWAPAVDRYGSRRLGRRRSWIVPMQLGVAALLAIAAFSDPAEPALLLVVLATNVFAATQDIATDALALDLLTAGERGLGNGVQVAGYRVGMVVGGGLLLVAHEHVGFRATMLGAASLALLATMPIALHREGAPHADGDSGATSSRALWRSLSRPEIRSWLLVLATYKAGDAMAVGMLRPFLVDAGLGLAEIGWLVGMIGFGAGLLGALAGGAALRRVGRAWALVAFGLIQSASIAAYALAADGSPAIPVLAAACLVEHFAGGMATTALFTAMMDRCRPEAAATDYTVQASLVAASSGVAAFYAGVLAEAIGYRALFCTAAIVSALGLALLASTACRSSCVRVRGVGEVM